MKKNFVLLLFSLIFTLSFTLSASAATTYSVDVSGYSDVTCTITSSPADTTGSYYIECYSPGGMFDSLTVPKSETGTTIVSVPVKPCRTQVNWYIVYVDGKEIGQDGTWVPYGDEY